MHRYATLFPVLLKRIFRPHRWCEFLCKDAACVISSKMRRRGVMSLGNNGGRHRLCPLETWTRNMCSFQIYLQSTPLREQRNCHIARYFISYAQTFWCKYKEGDGGGGEKDCHRQSLYKYVQERTINWWLIETEILAYSNVSMVSADCEMCASEHCLPSVNVNGFRVAEL